MTEPEIDLTPDPTNRDDSHQQPPEARRRPKPPTVTSIDYQHDGPATITHAYVTVEQFYVDHDAAVTFSFNITPGRAELRRVTDQRDLQLILRTLPTAEDAVADIPGVEEVVGIEGLVEDAEEFIAECEAFHAEDESPDGEEADASA